MMSWSKKKRIGICRLMVRVKVLQMAQVNVQQAVVVSLVSIIIKPDLPTQLRRLEKKPTTIIMELGVVEGVELAVNITHPSGHQVRVRIS